MSKFLSLSWFKSKIEVAVEKVVANKIESLMEQVDQEERGGDFDLDKKPYLRVKLVNDVLTIVLNDGEILTKPNASYEDYIKAKGATREEQLFAIVANAETIAEKKKLDLEREKAAILKQGMDKLGELPQFEIKDGSVYLKGINRSMPQILVEEFVQVVAPYLNNPYLSSQERADIIDSNDQFLALKRFFMWCCLNPRAEVAHELYRFLKENSFRITKQGF